MPEEGTISTQKLPVAILPIDNLSGMPAPLEEIRQSIIGSLKNKGVNILDEAVLNEFINRNRIRYVGGIAHSEAQAFREEAGAGTVLINSLELYNEISPPKIALMSRLVSTGKKASILWMKGSGMDGNDAPGLLNIGLIEDPKVLLLKTVDPLTTSLANFLAGQRENAGPAEKARKFLPEEVYSSPVITPDLKYRVAVLPFFNVSERKNAGEIISLHFIRHLRDFENFDVIEPGVERQSRLNLRIIMDDGISLASLDTIFNRLDADLILTGKILDYQDYRGTFGKPKVSFSAQLIEKKSREVVWSIRSYHEGDERVIFFKLGKVNTAHSLASMMVQQALSMIKK